MAAAWTKTVRRNVDATSLGSDRKIAGSDHPTHVSKITVAKRTEMRRLKRAGNADGALAEQMQIAPGRNIGIDGQMRTAPRA